MHGIAELNAWDSRAGCKGQKCVDLDLFLLRLPPIQNSAAVFPCIVPCHTVTALLPKPFWGYVCSSAVLAALPGSGSGIEVSHIGMKSEMKPQTQLKSEFPHVN